jgi:hypothetical protein
MNNEMEWMWKLAAVAQVEVLFWYLNARHRRTPQQIR